MKTIQNLAIAGLIVVIGLYFWPKPAPKPPKNDFEATVKAASAAVVATSMAKAIQITEATPKPKEPEPKKTNPFLLPDGEFYTLNRVSQVTENGVAGIKKGVKVKAVGEENGKIKVTDGVVTVLASRIDLTNEIMEIKKMQDATAFSSPVPVLAKEPSAPVAAPKLPNQNIARENPAIKQIDARIEALKNEIQELEAKPHKGKISAWGPVIARKRAEIEALTAQRNSLTNR